jgi:hypothetical protein
LKPDSFSFLTATNSGVLTWSLKIGSFGHSRPSSVVTDPGIGIQRSDSSALFAGERKSGSSRQGFESLLPGKKHPKLPEFSLIWASFGTIFFFAVFSDFLPVYPFGVNGNYCNGSFLWNLEIRIRKIRIGFKSFF